MKRILLTMMALSLTGCQMGGLLAGDKANLAPTPPSSSDRSLARFGGLSFGKLSSDGAGYLGGNMGLIPNAAGALPSSAQTPSMPVTSTADAAIIKGGVATPAGMDTGMSIPVPSVGYYGGYSSGPFGQMKLDSVTEAKGPGATGTLKQVIASVVAPVLKDWAADGALVGSSGATGEPAANTPFWMLNYASPAQREAMIFFITPKETRVLFLRWSNMTINMDEVKVESSEAIQSVLEALRDLSIKSKEELLGQDFFYSEFSGGMGGAMPMIGMAPPATSVSVGKEPVPRPAPMPAPLDQAASNSQPILMVTKSEPVLELAPGGSWNVNLAPIGSHLVWNLYYSAPMSASMGMPTRYPPQEGDSNTWTNSYVSAMIDARTGALLRLMRPTTTTITWVKSSK